MKRTKVWDVPVRVFHWALAVAVGVALLTGEEDEWAGLHAQAGLLILGLVVFRVVFGLVGTPYARFAAFVRRPAEVLGYARAFLRGRPPVHLSHNPLGGMMVLLLLGTLALTALTGVLLKLGPEWDGALALWMSKSTAHAIKEVHEVAASSLLVLIPLHVVGTLLSSRLEGQNLVASMITGWKKASNAETAPPMSHTRGAFGLVTALAVGIGVVVLVSAFLPAQAEAAETPTGMLDAYRREAVAAEPGFRGFDPARGQQLYLKEHVQDGKSSACTTCHTLDPTQEGRSPAGKRIEALAPSVSPSRFTDRRTTDKWFDRNCKQVLGRVCTTTEKGDLLSWVITLGRN